MNIADSIETLQREMWKQFCQEENILAPGTTDIAEILVTGHVMRITFFDLTNIRLNSMLGIVVRFQLDSGQYSLIEGLYDGDPPRLWKKVYTTRKGHVYYFQHPCMTSHVSRD